MTGPCVVDLPHPVPLDTATFRANPRYDLVEWGRLNAAEYAVIRGGESPENLFGVLRPRSGDVDDDLRSVSPDTALLVMVLRTPAPLPTYLRAQLGDKLGSVIGRLLLDRVLEVEHDGRFVSGSEAAGLLSPGGQTGGEGRIGALSIAAMRYAQSLDLPDNQLAPRLYLYGRRPYCPALVRRMPDTAAVAVALGLENGGALSRDLDSGWMEDRSKARAVSGWRSWRRRGTRRTLGQLLRIYKLYVSADLDHIASALAAIVGSGVVARTAKAFKIAGRLYDLCRADRLILYFDALEDLQQAAFDLRDRLQGCPADGVPFTATIAGDGLLSWGVDPLLIGNRPTDAVSWRLIVTERLGRYLGEARKQRVEGYEPWQVALQRLRLSGIDGGTWTPAESDWAKGGVRS
ncbi:hypothetical protein [Ruegeria jejuensis]|uniref:hypothetical protein n=1 Tax=Ruegeria jejuensis TaxID=3233338 RepID=UPI00355BD60B